MSITTLISNDGTEASLKIQGRFDFSLLQTFRNAYESINPAPKRFLIDLSEASYLDSSALGMLLGLRDYAGGEAANIRIIGANPDVKKILIITKLDELFKLEP